MSDWKSNRSPVTPDVSNAPEGWTKQTPAASNSRYEWNFDDKKWKGTKSVIPPRKFYKLGESKPEKEENCISTWKDNKLKTLTPLKNLQIYPSVDPYLFTQRELFRVLMKECPWVLRANRIIQQLTIQNSVRMIFPRDQDELSEEELELWRDKPITVPNFEGEAKDMTPNEIKKYIDKLASKLDLDSLVFDAFLFEREQGRSAIAMFPETRDKRTGRYVIPQVLRVIRPDLLRRPIIDFDTGELRGVELNQLSSNGGLLDANRIIYFFLSKNLELFGDFYGISSVEAVADVGQVLLIIYARDFENAANRTWRTPNIFRHKLPTKNFGEAQPMLEDFNDRVQNNRNEDISVPYDVEVVTGTSNPGDINGLIGIENSCIDAIAGYYNIPPFMLAKGKAGNLGGNANREEIDAFLTNEIRPNQQRFENILKDQFYDRILCILFDEEPEAVDKIEPEVRHNFEKPSVSTSIDPDEWQIHMQLVDNGYTTMEQVMEKYGLRDIMSNPANQGTDTSPTIKTWEQSIHPTWTNNAPKGWEDRRSKLSKWHDHSWGNENKWNKIQDKKGDVLDSVNEQVKIDTAIKKKELERNDKD